MKGLFAFVSIVALSAGSAFAADGQVSSSALANTGLSSLQFMSDSQGMHIRGMSSHHSQPSSSVSITGGQGINVGPGHTGEGFSLNGTNYAQINLTNTEDVNLNVAGVSANLFVKVSVNGSAKAH